MRGWITLSWVLLPAVMVGGGLLRRRAALGDPTASQLTWIRAFHAHGAAVVTAALRVGIVLGVVVAAGACDDAPAGPSPVIEGTWRLLSLQRASNAPVQVADPGRYTVSFEGDGDVGIRSDCNSCGAAYQVIGTTLRIRDFVCTEVACAPPTLDPEFVTALEAARTVTVEQSEAVVEGGGWTLRFVQ